MRMNLYACVCFLTLCLSKLVQLTIKLININIASGRRLRAHVAPTCESAQQLATAAPGPQTASAG